LSSIEPLDPSISVSYDLVISSDTPNYDIFNAVIALGWNGTTPAIVTVTVNTGVFVYSRSSSQAAMFTNTGWPTGSQITIINKGFIGGAGGNGGIAGWDNIPGGNGYPGGNGINAQFSNIYINNFGSIAGGGGGGGGGGGVYGTPTVGTGGGGQGNIGGYPGGGAAVSANLGGYGSVSGPGAGGSPTGLGGGSGGTGGTWGHPGNSGTNGRASPAGSGGAAGYAVRLSSGGSVTWIAYGTVLGNVG
jgi:hypothetical protein